MTQTWNISNIAQAAGIAALECDSFVEDNRKIIHEERRYLTKSLRKLGIKVFDSDVNFILFQVQENSEQLYETLLKRGILIRKCDNFRGLENNFYRCAVKIHDENKVLIEALEAHLSQT